MPEVITKHPEIVIKVLTSQGAQCRTGAKPKILKDCPSNNFCTLAGGELCVYGPDELGKMTQLSRSDLCHGSASPTSTGAFVPPAPPATGDHPNAIAAPMAIAMLAGIGLVRFTRRPRRR